MTDTVDLARLGRMPELSGRTTSAHVLIERWLATAITRGELVEGDRLPPEERLAGALGVSRMTLRHALSTLAARGVVERRRGRMGGTFIARPRVPVDLTGLVGFTEQMRRSQLRAGASVVSARECRAEPEVAAALELAGGASVFEVVRVRSANRQRLALERSFLPAQLFPGLLEQRLSGSLYALMRTRYGRAPVMADEALESVVAAEPESELLGVPAGSPLLAIDRTARTAAGIAVECARDLFRSDLVRITLRTGIPDPDH